MSASIEASESKIEKLTASIAADEKELKEATALREKEAADFAASESELIIVLEPSVVTMVRTDLRASMSRMVVTTSPVE